MQRVFCVRFSGDGSYVFSGSDDMNVRVWKSDASEQLGVTLPREKHKAAYNKALINRCGKPEGLCFGPAAALFSTAHL
jgi:WD repeat and SOF domain-containing protein 1